MCGENQKTLKFYTEMGKKERTVLCSDTLGSSLAEVPPGPLAVPQECGSRRGNPEGLRAPSPGKASPGTDTGYGNNSSRPRAAGEQLPYTVNWSFQVETRNIMRTLSEQNSAQGSPLPGSCL